MSEVKVNKITPTADCGTVTLGDSGDTVAIPSGVTLTSAGSITNSGTITNTGTISGGTITGTIDNQVNWQTTVKTTAFTATAGEGYFCNTTSAAFTVTLPASPSAGDIVGIKDYANTADTNNITIGRNGSNIQGTANDFVIDTEGLAIILLYVDATKGWLSVGQSKAADISEQQLYVTATGGTVTTSGDFKIHTFTGPGTFCVSCGGNSAGNDKVDYLVLAGGGGGGPDHGGAGGAGGYRESHVVGTSGCYTASPLASSTSLPVTAQAYPITVGSGGTGGGATPCCAARGSSSIFSTITSTGGGGIKAGPPPLTQVPMPGGSGSGAAGQGNSPGVGGLGNTPPVSPPQGNNGGASQASPNHAGSGGGGAGGVGGTGGSPQRTGGSGGAGTTTSITTSPVVRASGGSGGGSTPGTSTPATPGGGGRGGAGSTQAGDGTANTGGGGGGGTGNAAPYGGGNGGSGLVVIRYKFQN
jgi:hypothetical protein